MHMSYVRVLHKTFCSFIGTVTSQDYHDCFGEVWNKSENEYRSWGAVTAKIYLVYSCSMNDRLKHTIGIKYAISYFYIAKITYEST